MGTYASGYMHTLRHMGYLFIGNSILCSRNTIYILMKTLRENTQKYQLQEALIWNPFGRTIRVQSSVLWLLLHGPSLMSSSLPEFQFSLLNRDAPMLSFKSLFSSKLQSWISNCFKTCPLCYPTITWMCKTNPTFYPTFCPLHSPYLCNWCHPSPSQKSWKPGS